MMGKSRRKLLELSLPRKIVHQKRYCIAGQIARISASVKELKEARVVISITSLFLLCV